MPEDEFIKHVNSLVTNLTEKDKNLRQETSRLWSTISSGYYDFTRREEEAAMVQTLTLKDLLLFCKRFICLSSSDCSRLCVHFVSTKATAAPMSVSAMNLPISLNNNLSIQQRTRIDITSISEFHRSLPLFPGPVKKR